MPIGSSGHSVLMALSNENLPKSQGLVPCLPQPLLPPPTLQGLTPVSSGIEVNGGTAKRNWTLQDCTLIM